MTTVLMEIQGQAADCPISNKSVLVIMLPSHFIQFMKLIDLFVRPKLYIGLEKDR